MSDGQNTITPEKCQDARAAALADPDREGIVTVTLEFPGGCEVTYAVRAPVIVHGEHGETVVHSRRVTPYSESIERAKGIHDAARARLVDDREKLIRALLAREREG